MSIFCVLYAVFLNVKVRFCFHNRASPHTDIIKGGHNNLSQLAFANGWEQPWLPLNRYINLKLQLHFVAIILNSEVPRYKKRALCRYFHFARVYLELCET